LGEFDPALFVKLTGGVVPVAETMGAIGALALGDLLMRTAADILPPGGDALAVSPPARTRER